MVVYERRIKLPGQNVPDQNVPDGHAFTQLCPATPGGEGRRPDSVTTTHTAHVRTSAMKYSLR